MKKKTRSINKKPKPDTIECENGDVKRHITLPEKMNEALVAFCGNANVATGRVIKDAIAMFIHYEGDPHDEKTQRKQQVGPTPKAYLRGQRYSFAELAYWLGIETIDILNCARQNKMREFFERHAKAFVPPLWPYEIKSLADQYSEIFFDLELGLD